jgi:photosystem II stability/assembly factor-like uncharacterized protein
MERVKRSFIIFFIALASIANAQQVTLCPLDLSNTFGAARIYSAPQHDVLWIGIDGYLHPNDYSKTFAITTDAGQTFRMDTIPDANPRGFTCIWALDSMTAWAGLNDPNSITGGAIWKTTDGGHSWTLKTVNGEFAGGYLDYMAFFTPDSGVAFGDRNGGYFEIYTTTNGGDSWTRVSSLNIPSALPGEAGNYGNWMSVVDNSIWCPTWNGRVYYSTDRGYHWQVSTVRTGVSAVQSSLSMSDTLYGAAVYPPFPQSLYLTSDGGASWNNFIVSGGLDVERVSRIPGVPGAYVFVANGGIYTTTDTFNTTYPIVAPLPNLYGWSIEMYDATIGWTNPDSLYFDSSLFKISNVITGITGPEPLNVAALSVMPNPVKTGYALVSWKMNAAGKSELSLFDLQGRLQKTVSISCRQGTNATVFDFTNLPGGIYFLRLCNDRKSTVRVIIN